MAKKTRKADVLPRGGSEINRVISPAGKIIIAIGVGCLFAGFFLLTKTDSMGKNLPSTLSPLFLIAGYGLIAAGIIYPGHPRPSPDPSAGFSGLTPKT